MASHASVWRTLMRHASWVRHEHQSPCITGGRHATTKDAMVPFMTILQHAYASLTRKRSLVQTQYRPRTNGGLRATDSTAHASLVRQGAGTGGLAARLDAVHAAELAAGVSRSCSHVGCDRPASSSVRVPFCPGHAGFAAVRGMVTA